MVRSTRPGISRFRFVSRNNSSILVHCIRIEQPFGVDKDKARTALTRLDLAIEARFASGVAGRADLLDADPDRVLVAIHAHLDHALGLTRGLTLSPQRPARAAVVPGLPALDRSAQRLVVHMRDHQHLAARSVSCNAGQESRRVEFGLE